MNLGTCLWAIVLTAVDIVFAIIEYIEEEKNTNTREIEVQLSGYKGYQYFILGAGFGIIGYQMIKILN